MIKTRTQLNALIRNKAAGDGDKAQILLRIYIADPVALSMPCRR